MGRGCYSRWAVWQHNLCNKNLWVGGFVLENVFFYDIIISMKRSLWFWLYFVLSVVFAVYFASRVIMVFMGHGDISRVRNISITADQNNKDLSALANVVALPPGTATYSINLADMNARVATVPGVKNSAVRRLPNGNIVVRTAMYTAVALWSDGKHFYPLSADGTIVNSPTDVRDAGHVVFRGTVPNDIDMITKVAHNLVGVLDYLEWIEDRRWNLHTFAGITVMLPEQNPEDAIGTLISLNNKHKILSRDISVIDMRDETRILVK